MKKKRTQEDNLKEYKDVFEKIDSVYEMKYPTADKAQGARMACMFIRNYLLNRGVNDRDGLK